MRLTYYETFEGLPRVENQIRMEKPDFDDNQDLHAAWNKVRQWVNGRAWEDYKIKTKMDGCSAGRAFSG